MRISFTGLFLCIIILTHSSCSSLYFPSIANVPLHAKKGDAQISASYGILGSSVQASLAVTPHVFVNVNAGLFPRKKGVDELIKHKIAELGLGYYYEHSNVVLELGGGYGFGNTEHLNAFSFTPFSPVRLRFHAKSNYHKFFLQPSMGFSTEHVDMAFTARVVFLQYVNFGNYFHDKPAIKVFPGLVSYFEPIVTMRWGFKNLKLFGQVGFSLAMNAGHHPLSNHLFLPLLSIGLCSEFHIKPIQRKTNVGL